MSNSLIGSFDKIYSNLRVKNLILKNYDNRLSRYAKNVVYKHILVIYNKALSHKKIKFSLLVIKVLFLNINKTSLDFFNKLLLLLKILIAFFSYYIFSKGSILLQFNPKSNIDVS
jgi:hypothetical protein